MSNPNQSGNGQPQTQAQPKAEPEMVKCRVVGARFLLSHSKDSDEDNYAEIGSIVEVPKKYFENLKKARQFDCYHQENGGISELPFTKTDLTLELVDPKAA